MGVLLLMVCSMSVRAGRGPEVLTRSAARIAGANAARKEKRCGCISGAQAGHGGVRRRWHLSHSRTQRTEVAGPACCLLAVLAMPGSRLSALSRVSGDSSDRLPTGRPRVLVSTGWQLLASFCLWRHG